MNIVGVYSDPSPVAVNYMSIASHSGVVADWIIPGYLYNASTGSVQFGSVQKSIIIGDPISDRIAEYCNDLM